MWMSRIVEVASRIAIMSDTSPALGSALSPMRDCKTSRLEVYPRVVSRTLNPIS
jgi:hypothetical protein